MSCSFGGMNVLHFLIIYVVYNTISARTFSLNIMYGWLLVIFADILY